MESTETEGANTEASWAEAAAASEDAHEGHEIAEHKRTVERILAVPLTEEELAARARRMAELRGEVGRLEEAKKAAAAEYKGKIDRINADVDEIASEVRAGSREEGVQCAVGIDATGNNMVTVRKDTGAVIDVRALTPAERQGNFHFVEGGAQDEEDEDDGEPQGGGTVVSHPAARKPTLEELADYSKGALVDCADRWGIEVNAKAPKGKLLDAVRAGLYPAFAPERGDDEATEDGDDAS